MDLTRRPIALFVAAVYVITWTLPILVRPPASPDSIWLILAGLLPVVWAPTIVALILTRWFDGPDGVRNELRTRLRYKSGSGPWLAVAGLVPLTALAIAVMAARLTGSAAPWTPMDAIPVMIGVQIITGAVGEELGWRGYLLPRLAHQIGEVAAGWTMAFLWSVWHLPAFFTPGMPHQFMPIVPALASVVFFGVFLAFVFGRTGGSVLATMLAHLSFNVGSGLGGAQLSSYVFWVMLDIIFGVAAIAVTARLLSRGLERQH